MPRGDMTGPPQRGSGKGMGGGRKGGNRSGAGPGGECICPQCGNKVTHQTGTPCYNISCPKCGTKMARG